jgi:hypothetical protein
MSGVLYYKRADGLVVPVSGQQGPQGVQGVQGPQGEPRQVFQIKWSHTPGTNANGTLETAIGPLCQTNTGAAGIALFNIWQQGGFATGPLNIWEQVYSNSFVGPSPPGYGYTARTPVIPNLAAGQWHPLPPLSFACPVAAGGKPDCYARIIYEGPNCYGTGFAIVQYFPGAPWTNP